MEKVWESGRRASRSISRGMGMDAWGVDEAFMPRGGSRSRRGSRGADDDEEALRWAAIERLPTYSRVRTAILSSVAEAEAGAGAGGKPRQPQFKEVDVRKLAVGDRQEFIERVFRVADEDNQRFLQKLRNRIDRYKRMHHVHHHPLLLPFLPLSCFHAMAIPRHSWETPFRVS